MGVKIKITEINPELEQQLQERYGFDVETIKTYVGQEVTLKSDELYELLKDAEKEGILKLDAEKEKTPEDIGEDAEQEEKEQEESKEQEDGEVDEEAEEPIDEEMPMNPERKEYETYLRTRAMQMLEQLDVYKNLPPEAQYKIISAYDKVADVGDIWDENFLDKRLNDGTNGEMIANVKQIHMMVLGGITVQGHIQSNQQNAETQLDQSEINSQSAEHANQIEVSIPRLITELDPYIKNEAEQEMARKVKKYIEMATTNKPAAQTLMVIGDLKGYMEEIKQDSLGEVDAGSDTEAAKLYLAQMPITEMGVVMAAMKDATEGVQVRFDDIDWNNEIERKVAINLLAQTQQVAQEIGSTDQVVDRVNIQFEVDDWSDVQEMTHTCRDLKEAGIIQTTEVAATVKIPDDIPIEQKEELTVAAGQVLTTNGIEVETTENDLVDELVEGMVPGNGIDELSSQADRLPMEMARAIDVAARVIAHDIIEPGMSGNTNP